MKANIKKLLGFMLAICLIFSMIPTTVLAAAPGTLYLKVSDDWKEGGARFAVYYFNSTGATAWRSMTDSDGDGYYEAEAPSEFTTAIFCRMNGGTTDNNWDNRLNQTADLPIPADGKNCFELDSGWSNTGSWTTYIPAGYECPHTSHDTEGKCTACGETVGHKYVDGFCTVCGGKDPNYAVSTDPTDSTDPVDSSDPTNPSEPDDPMTDAVAVIGNAEYATLQAAIDDAEAAGSKVTVKLMKAVTTPVTVDAGNFVLDLNGNSITASSAITVSGGELTVVDSGNGGLIDGGSSWMNHAIVISAGTLNIQGGSITTTGFMGCGINQSGGTVNVSGGTVHGSYGVRISNGELNVSGGKIYSGDAAVYTEGGNVNVSGGTLCGKMGNGNAIYMSSGTGTVTITGGNLGGNSNDYNIYASGGKLLIQGGTFDMVASPGGIRCDVSDAEVQISGGTFKNGIWYSCNSYAPYQELSALLAEGCNFYDADGKVVELASGVKKITSYTTVAKDAPDAGEEVIKPTLTLSYPTLSFESEVFYNVYFTATNKADVVEMGLLTWDQKPANADSANINTADSVIPGEVYNEANGTHMVRSNGIPAKQLGDNLFMRVYAKLSDGSYVYSSVTYYNAKLYANDILANSSNANMKALVVAMLNYGAAAQVHFNHNADNLMNAGLTAEQKALVNAYSDDMISALVTPDSAKTANFVYNKGYSGGYPSVSFEGAFAINYYLTPKYAVTGDFTLYCWDLATYNAVDALTEDNATATVSMSKAGSSSQYVGSFTGLAAKQIDETVVAVAVYESNGTRYVSPVINYSIGAYCLDQIANGSDTMKAFAKETAVYGYYAEAYFA